MWGELASMGASLGSSLGMGLLEKQWAAGANAKANDAAKAWWYQQMDYNSPKNQVARLKEAHLNPALAYGNGSVVNTGSPTAVVKQMDVPGFRGAGNLPNFYEVRNQSLTGQMMERQIQQVEAQTRKTRAEAEVAEATAQAYKGTGLVPSDPAALRMFRLMSGFFDGLFGQNGDVRNYLRSKWSGKQYELAPQGAK